MNQCVQKNYKILELQLFCFPHDYISLLMKPVQKAKGSILFSHICPNKGRNESLPYFFRSSVKREHIQIYSIEK